MTTPWTTDLKSQEYFENPDEFTPERWLKEQNVPTYAFTPFSTG